jgi:purine-binding chemotaxis protein CheW
MQTRHGQFFVVRMNRCWVTFEVKDVIETMRPLPMSKVADVPAFVLGLAVIRGRPTPVVDLQRLLSGQPGTVMRFVTVRPNRFAANDDGRSPVALGVAAVEGVRKLGVDLHKAQPALLKEASSDAVQAISTLDRELMLVLDAARVLSAEIWQTLKRAITERDDD